MAAIVLTSRVLDSKNYMGSGSVQLAAGEFLRVESTPGGEELLNEQVPAGKQWAVEVWVNVVETDE